MNKTELIDHIAQEADISKAAAGRALDAVIGGVKGTLKKGGSVTLVGFGTFAVGKRTARTGRNPRTGAAIKIKAAKVPKFRPGKALKDAINYSTCCLGVARFKELRNLRVERLEKRGATSGSRQNRGAGA
jgi:DNA-binding protein HU-beta